MYLLLPELSRTAMSSSDQQSAHKLSESPAAVEVQKSASVNVCLGVRLNTQKGREFKGRCVCACMCVRVCVYPSLLRFLL